jgi:methylamine utilization protein MauJ
VGGPDASFQRCENFGKALEVALTDEAALDSLIEIRVSDGEMYTNAHGRAAISYRFGDQTLTAYYINAHAGSLLQPGAEKTFNPRDLISSIVTEQILYPPFLKGIANVLKREASMPPISLSVPPEDDDEEARKEQRAKRLGLRPNSSFLNIGVDNQITWPPEEAVVEFEGHKFILLPKTRDNTTSIHIDLHGQRIGSEDAITLINRFLSLVAWCDDQFAIRQDGWSGNPVPVPVPKRSLGFNTAHHWIFDRKTPASDDARRALALYREGRNAEQNYLIGYAILSYYKILELKYSDGKDEKVQKWIADNYPALKEDKNLAREIAAFEEACGDQEPHLYVARACRIAVARASAKHPSDPDDFHELRRLHVAARVIRALARRFISSELAVSDCFFDGS